MEELSKENQSMDAIDRARKGDLKFFKEAPLDILLNARDSNGYNVLWIVVNNNHVDCCKEICKRCPSLLCPQPNKDGGTPLFGAAYRGYLDILKILISTCDKADLENQHVIENQGGDRADLQKTLTWRDYNGIGENALHRAIQGGRHESVKLLIEADTNKELLRAGHSTPLHLAMRYRIYHHKTAKLLIEADPDFPYGADSHGKTPLLMAIEKQNNSGWSYDPVMLKFILKLQPTQSMVKYNENGWTALHYCVSKQYLSTIEDIIQSCPESSKVADNEGQNFFHHAVKSGNVKMVKHILGIKEIIEDEVLNSKDNMRRTPLNVALESQNEIIILHLLADSRVNFNEDDIAVILNSVDENGDTILFKAAQDNHSILYEELYERYPFLIYHQRKGGCTVLHYAAWRGELEMVKVLIKADAKFYNDYNIQEENPRMLYMMVDEQGDTALHKAVLNHKLKAVKLLLEADLDYKYIENNNGDTPIMIAIREARSNENKFDSVKIRQLFFEMQPKQTMALRGEKGWTSLPHQATSEEDLSIIEDIIKFCTGYLDVVPVDNNGKNFLHIAVELGKIEVVRLVLGAKDIIKLKSCLEQVDNEGKNFLHIAAELGNVEVVRLVLRAKDIINLTSCLEQLDNEGKNFLHIAAELGNVAVVRLVLRAKNDIIMLKSCLEQVDNEGKNFLHIAAEFEKVGIVKQVLRDKDISEDILKKKDKDISLHSILNKIDKDGNTPFHIAALTGNEPLTRCFLFHDRVYKDTRNNKQQHVLSEIKFPYDKRKAGVHHIADTVDQSELKDQSDFDLVVGALIATVSFAAGITVPGGYISDGPNQGTAVFSKRVSFASFTISNSFALVFSLFAVFSHFCARRLSWDADIICLLYVAKFCTLAAMYCMMAAFIAGSFAILAKSNWLAIVVCIIGCLFFIFGCGPLWMWKIGKQSKRPASQHIQIWFKKCFGLRNALVEDGGNALVSPKAF